MPLLNTAILAAESNVTASILFWAFGLIVLLIVMLLSAVWIKKRMSPTEESAGGGGFTLADLRELRKSGAMTEEEYERAKAKMVQSLQAAASRKQPAPGPKIPPAASD